MEEEKQEVIDTMHNTLDIYKIAVDRGKRTAEIIKSLKSSLVSLGHLVEGTYENPLMGLIDMGGGQRKLPIEDQDDLDTLDELKQRMVTFLQECEQIELEDPCNHDWLIEGTAHSGGGVLPSGPYIDMHCSDCESSITSYNLEMNYPVWLRYLTPEEQAQIPHGLEYDYNEEAGKSLLITKWEDIHKLVDLCLEHKIEFVPLTKSLSALIKEGTHPFF